MMLGQHVSLVLALGRVNVYASFSISISLSVCVCISAYGPWFVAVADVLCHDGQNPLLVRLVWVTHLGRHLHHRPPIVSVRLGGKCMGTRAYTTHTSMQTHTCTHASSLLRSTHTHTYIHTHTHTHTHTDIRPETVADAHTRAEGNTAPPPPPPPLGFFMVGRERTRWPSGTT
jgi:hypothetical protein